MTKETRVRAAMLRTTARWGVGALFALGAWAASASPLHEEIDRLVAAKAGGVVAGRGSDAEFLRRVYLDLTGSIPTAAEARRFLDDPSPGKRAGLIDRLLASPEFPRRMQEAFGVMLMERRIGSDAEWEKYLRDFFA